MKKPFQLILLFITLNSTLSAQNIPSYVPANGLIGWWPFNGNANDETGNGNNGILINGVSSTADRFGYTNAAFSFDGVDDFIWAGFVDALNGATSATVSYWCNSPLNFPNNPAGNYGCAFGHWKDNGQYNGPIGLQIATISNGSVNASLIGGQGANSSTGVVSPNQWTNLVVVFDGQNPINQRVLLYINGIFTQYINISNAPTALGTEATRTYFGAACGPTNQQNSWCYFNGKLDDIGIWNRALTQQEVTNLYNASTPATTCPNLPSNLQSGLVGYWPFCGNANDESGNGNNGIAIGNIIFSNDRFSHQNSCVEFDGATGYIKTTTTNFPSNERTISFWINAQTYTSRAILGYGGNGSCGSSFILTTDMSSCNGTNKMIMHNHCCVNNFTAELSFIPLNQWSHIVLELSQDAAMFYINDSLVATDSSISFITPINNSEFGIGTIVNYLGQTPFIDINSNLFYGKLDDICIWNRALSATEVSQLYAAQSVNPTNNSSSGGNGNSVATNFPSGISYQAVARDSVGQSLSNTPLTVRFTLRDSSISGTAVYTETHTITTNSLGLFTTVIGSGTPVQGTYSSINWMGPQKFLSVEIDSGSGFQLIGNQQLLSVPYANAAKSATQLNNANLPIYNDNAAALNGGLQAGQLYRTATGVLMVVY